MVKYDKYSPAKQTTEMEKLAFLRKELYKNLGLNRFSFENRDVLEIGSGFGYNALANLLNYNLNSLTLIELNRECANGSEELLKDFENVEVINRDFLSVDLDKKFDIVIIEGTIHFMDKKEFVLKKIDNLLKKDGILIITSIDAISQFFDITRRLFANILIKDIEDFDEKVDILVKAFEPHTQSLKGFSKEIKDWCIDMFINDSLYFTFDIEEMLNVVDYEIYHMASPNLINDMRWYKHYDRSNYKIEQFNAKRHNLLHYKLNSCDRDIKLNIELKEMCKEYLEIIKKNEMNEFNVYKNDLIDILLLIKKNASFDKEISNVLEEILNILSKDNINYSDIANSKYFSQAFGRGMQYFSLIKGDL